jgi:hypothetical protein
LSSPQTRDNIIATADAEATAIVQATANAQATADIQADSPYPNYLQGKGYLVMDDSLSSYTHEAWWDRGSESFNGGTCESLEEDYQVTQTKQGLYFACFDRDPSNNHSAFSDVAFEIHMRILLGNCGGVFFRADMNGGSGYYFRICQDGTYELIRYADTDPAHRMVLLPLSTNSAIITGLNKTNIISVVANGETLTLYVNKKKIDSIQDAFYHSGQFALVADAFITPTEIAFFDARAWMIYQN